MNTYYITTKKQINKHLSIDMYEFIQSEYNYFISSKENKIGKTTFMKGLANQIGTTLSNLYDIIKDGMITIYSHDYISRKEFSANAAWKKRTEKSGKSNSCKLEQAIPFINLVIKDFRSDKNINSIDEIIHDLILNRPNEIKGMVTICTSTFYNYVKDDKIPGFNKKELPLLTKRKPKSGIKKGKTKGKGDSIENRPFEPDDRSDFGHWEGDLVVGARGGYTGAVLTLVERQTRHLLTVKLKNKKALTVLKAFYKLRNLYPDVDIKKVFKSITFDNGTEFSYWEKIEKYLDCKIYFAHPYSSWERGSNENCNKLLRIFFPKGCNFNNYNDEAIMTATELINFKIRKIHNYKSSLELFNDQLALLAD